MFDPIVKGLVKIAGKSPVMIYLTTALIALVSQLDGATATTYLITIPAMLPIFKKLNLMFRNAYCYWNCHRFMEYGSLGWNYNSYCYNNY